MDLLQLKYFSELAKRQHLNKTAQEMLVTPSAISSSLARLEKEMGVKLFDRVGRNIRLNIFIINTIKMEKVMYLLLKMDIKF